MYHALGVLATRKGFNKAVNHVKAVNKMVPAVARGENLADLIFSQTSSGQVSQMQIIPVVNAILVEKFSYISKVLKFSNTITYSQSISDQLQKWNNVQAVIVYHDPNSGIAIFNPKKEQHWSDMQIKHTELTVCYVTTLAETSLELKQGIIDDLVAVLSGGDVVHKPEYTKKSANIASSGATSNSVTAIQSQPSAQSVKKRSTPRYSVLVTNELFHNGNVEAWKRIIESYNNKYEGTDVMVWYEDERIHDLNVLFKWGKVKHGTPIVFSVAGDSIAGVAKLRRYLFEGASQRYEAFLKGGVGKALQLF